jgi:hypothetical protein
MRESSGAFRGSWVPDRRSAASGMTGKMRQPAENAAAPHPGPLPAGGERGMKPSQDHFLRRILSIALPRASSSISLSR